jgi:hypothetical protein
MKMCVTLEKANLSNTTLVISSAKHPKTRKPVHVLTYKNRVQNLAPGPNAMFLHFPAAAPMTKENLVDTSGFVKYTEDILAAVRPPVSQSVSIDVSDRGMKGTVEIFEHGIYTVMLASSPHLIPGALPEIPKDRRPLFNSEIFHFYGDLLPTWSAGLWLFNNRDAKDAAATMVHYEPIYPDVFMAPGLDCHTGKAPDLTARVDVDHWLIAGGKNSFPGAKRVAYRNENRIPAFARALLPDYVVGRHFGGWEKNADFLISNAETPSMANVTRGILQ